MEKNSKNLGNVVENCTYSPNEESFISPENKTRFWSKDHFLRKIISQIEIMSCSLFMETVRGKQLNRKKIYSHAGQSHAQLTDHVVKVY